MLKTNGLVQNHFPSREILILPILCSDINRYNHNKNYCANRHSMIK